MKYHLVIFDFDGTLADSYSWFLTVFGDIAERYRLPHLEKDDLELLRALDIRQIQKKYRVPLWKMFVIGNHLKKRMASDIDQISLVSGMHAVIATLAAQGVKMAIVTSNAEENVRRVLGPLNMAYFSAIESSVSMFGKKNKFQAVLRKTGVPAHRTLSIGDELRDLKSAHAAKIHFGAVSWGYTDPGTLQAHGPEEIFSHPAQILEAVNSRPT
jgi:phosphoglycolate phosphatase